MDRINSGEIRSLFFCCIERMMPGEDRDTFLKPTLSVRMSDYRCFVRIFFR